MGMTLKATKGFELIKPDIYEAIVTKFDTRESTYGPAALYTFQIIEGPQKGVEVSGMASIPANGLGPKSKLRQWMEAIQGRHFEDNDAIDVEDVIGYHCRINVKTEEKGESKFNKIADVLQTRGQKLREEPQLY
jgi:hypothetical protein